MSNWKLACFNTFFYLCFKPGYSYIFVSCTDIGMSSWVPNWSKTKPNYYGDEMLLYMFRLAEVGETCKFLPSWLYIKCMILLLYISKNCRIAQLDHPCIHENCQCLPIIGKDISSPLKRVRELVSKGTYLKHVFSHHSTAHITIT